MAGLIDDELPPEEQPQQAAPAEPQGLVDKQAADTERGSTNPILKQIMDQLVNGVPPNRRSDVERLVLAGMEVMFAPQMQAKIAQQLKSAAPEQSVPEGVAALLSLMQTKAKGPLPPAALVPASLILMCEAFDYLASAKLVEPSNEMVGKAAENMIAFMMQKMGITGAKIAEAKLQIQKMKQAKELPGGGDQRPMPEQPQPQAAAPLPPDEEQM